MAKKKAEPKPKPKPKPTPSPRQPKPVARPPGQVRVRMYRHGLGDCFLLSFPREGGKSARPFTVLIDCGIIPGTPGGDEKLKEVVDHLRESTAGQVDVLVATHEHADHVSGFDPKKGWFAGFEFGQVWLAWTEDPDDKLAAGLRLDRRSRLAALWMGFHQLRARLDRMGADGRSKAEVDRAFEVLSFFGIEPGQAPPEGGMAAVEETLVGGSTARSMAWVRTHAGARPKFWEPGRAEALEGAEGVRVYALGPPRDLAQLRKDLPSSGKRQPVETYEEDDPDDEAKAKAKARARRPGAADPDLAGAAERAFFGPAFEADGPARGGEGLPFDKKYRIEWEDAPKVAFFEDHYFGGDRSQEWRRIDAEWADGGASLALQLDGDTNNTSLALAFELPGGHVLLFPGDAQVGNWESWHADSDGRPRVFTEPGTGREVTAESLLNRVVLYKVGHHGSHNATLRGRGLEMMTRPGLAAMVPVDAYVAHVKKRWAQMPFNPLMRRLDEKVAAGRVVRADEAIQGHSPPAVAGPPARFEDADRPFQARFEVEGRAEPVERPLYVDYVLDLEAR